MRKRKNILKYLCLTPIAFIPLTTLSCVDEKEEEKKITDQKNFVIKNNLDVQYVIKPFDQNTGNFADTPINSYSFSSEEKRQLINKYIEFKAKTLNKYKKQWEINAFEFIKDPIFQALYQNAYKATKEHVYDKIIHFINSLDESKKRTPLFTAFTNDVQTWNNQLNDILNKDMKYWNTAFVKLGYAIKVLTETYLVKFLTSTN
ncbi:Uncharacterised protein [Metamycoplasma cloacale]|uniref:Uncharacterized protein n=1 Tax=Metamycoplasma cloacale TaxID=92401 RepID=A0A2Z4LM33_9BACT|nr:hypothetical protein [Metamycoplasma cloacale]AWX42528.1 hypothetical protein DK849_00290 [Metamycoplasma cloacale]VEU79126.1 Uncharacterised protein [Metamycoplasma cloacale]